MKITLPYRAIRQGYCVPLVAGEQARAIDVQGRQPADTRTETQKAAMRRLLEELHARYPRAVIVGHHDLNPQKDCPCILDVVHEYADLQP